MAMEFEKLNLNSLEDFKKHMINRGFSFEDVDFAWQLRFHDDKYILFIHLDDTEIYGNYVLIREHDQLHVEFAHVFDNEPAFLSIHRLCYYYEDHLSDIEKIYDSYAALDEYVENLNLSERPTNADMAYHIKDAMYKSTLLLNNAKDYVRVISSPKS